jgi:tRNA-modifying protein YgfZ
MDISSEIPLLKRGAWAAGLIATGDDASNFLQGQWSQDVRGVSVSRAARGLWLDRKGKVQGDAWIAAQAGGGFVVLSNSLSSQALRERLEAFIIADDVTLSEPYPSLEYTYLAGAQAAQVLTEAGLRAPEETEGGFSQEGEMFILRAAAPWGRDAIWCVSPVGGSVQPMIVQTALRLGWREVAEREAEVLRLEAGVPSLPVDCGPSDLPGEAGMDAPLVCYTKGCFIGQEVLARLRAQGTLRRGLRKLTGSGAEAPAAGSALYDGERRVGDVRSAAFRGDGAWIGLGMVTQASLPTELSLTPGGPREVRVAAAQAQD